MRLLMFAFDGSCKVVESKGYGYGYAYICPDVSTYSLSSIAKLRRLLRLCFHVVGVCVEFIFDYDLKKN
jgi:hypothetical protein